MIPDRDRGVYGPSAGPVDGVLAVLDVLLRRAPHMVAKCAYVDDELVHGALGDSAFAFTPHGGMDAQHHYRK